MRHLAPALVLLFATGCSSYWQVGRLEEKVDRLLLSTKRETLSEIFGEQSREITQKMDKLSESERKQLDQLVESYERGSETLEDVRSNMFSVMGGSDRVVSSGKGIWVRDGAGSKVQAIRRDTKIVKCQRLEAAELPERISGNRRLAKFTWGKGQLDGETVLFPWELTMSSFTREIVENTAKRTVQEFLRMQGDKGWNRPVHIKVITEDPGQSVTISHPGSEEIFVEGDDAEAPVE